MEQQFIELLLGPLGTLTLALIIIWTGVRKKWVFGWVFEKEEKEKQEWKEAALRGTYAAERAVDLATATHAREKDNA